MKNLKKNFKNGLKPINGGIETCAQNCLVGYRKRCPRGQARYSIFG